VKDALTTAAFKSYVPMILEECELFFSEWKFNTGNVNVFHELSDLTIRTASRCLMGKEIRAQLKSNVAQLYADLDAGFAPINVFFRWLPLPSYLNRDRANRIMTETFLRILKERRQNSDLGNEDVLQGLMDATYKNGTKVSSCSCCFKSFLLIIFCYLS
jgi:sterol 14-demethylase